MSSVGCTLRFVLNGRTRSHEVPTDQQIVIGRLPECDLVLPDPSVSRKHARLGYDGNRWYIAEISAKNGVLVNGVRVDGGKKRPLDNGDRVRLGSVELDCAIRGMALPATSSDEILFSPAELGKTHSEALDMVDLNTVIAESFRGDVSGSPMPAMADPAKSSISTDSMHRTNRVVALFAEAAESLLACTDLDSMLDNVLELVFRHLPAQRGSICLWDGGNLVPRALRTASGAAEQLQISRTIVDDAISSNQAKLVTDTSTDSEYNDSESIVMMNIRSAMCVPLTHAQRVAGVIYVDTEDDKRPFTSDHLSVLRTLSVLSAVAIEKTKLKEEIVREQVARDRISRYCGKVVVDHILQSAPSQMMIANEAEVSVIFADIAGFTSMSERLKPFEVTRILNGIFERLTAVVFEHDGTLDKFIGDEVMAFFGAPIKQDDHAIRAVRTALTMQQRLDEYNSERPDAPPVRMSIGINSGSVVVGDIGSPERKDYTIIGDTVNTAKRIESKAGVGEIAIGPATYEFVKDLFELEAREPMRFKGKEEPVQTYLVRGPKPDSHSH